MDNLKKQFFYDCLTDRYGFTSPDAMTWLRMMEKASYEKLKDRWRELRADKEAFEAFTEAFKEKEYQAARIGKRRQGR